MFYEIIYETGNHSIAMYESDDEAIRAISEHHRRAKNGEKAQATNEQMGPAERIVKVLKYDEHPADYSASGAVDSQDVTAAVEKAIADKGHGGLVSVMEVAAAVRDVSSPTVDSAPHDSNYKMKEVGNLDRSRWDNDV